MDELPLAPRAIHDGTVTHAGRFLGAIAQPNLSGPLTPWCLKQWSYVSVTTDTHFLAFALVQLGYVANLFCYLVDRRSRAMWQVEAMAPLGIGLTIADSSVDGATVWRRGSQELRLDAIARGWRATFALTIQGKSLQGTAEIERGEGLAVVHPVGPRRWAYTHKEAAMLADLDLKWDGQPLPKRGLAALDWTRAAYPRHTLWNWASFSTRLRDGRRLGLNLSAHVLDNADGVSQENALWVDGRLHLLGAATFSLPASPAAEVWHLRGDDVNLAFTPLGARQQDVNLGVVRSRFVQPFGHFAGHLRLPDGDEVALAPSFGVVEDHLAVW